MRVCPAAVKSPCCDLQLPVGPCSHEFSCRTTSHSFSQGALATSPSGKGCLGATKSVRSRAITMADSCLGAALMGCWWRTVAEAVSVRESLPGNCGLESAVAARLSAETYWRHDRVTDVGTPVLGQKPARHGWKRQTGPQFDWISIEACADPS